MTDFRAQAFEGTLRQDRDCSAGRGNNEKGKKARERASVGIRRNAALSRLVTKRGLARLARVCKFVANLRRGIRKISRKEGKRTTENLFSKFANLCSTKAFFQNKMLRSEHDSSNSQQNCYVLCDISRTSKHCALKSMRETTNFCNI